MEPDTLAIYNEQIKKSFDFSLELTKQMLTLSTGLLAFSIAVVKDVVGAKRERTTALFAAWFCLLISMAFGLQAIGNLWGTLAVPSDVPGRFAVVGDEVTWMSRLQMLCFLLGTILLLEFTWRNIARRIEPSPPPT